MERVVHRGLLGATISNEIFTDLVFADDTSILVEMLEIIILSLEVTQDDTLA